MSQIDEKLNSHRASDNSIDIINLNETDLTYEKQEFADKIEYDYQEDNEMSIHYFCSMCPASFDKKSSLFFHFTVMHEKPKTGKNLDCDICDAHFPFESKLKRHMKNVHEKSKPFKLKPHGCKGQLILKCPFGIILTKIPTKIL